MDVDGIRAMHVVRTERMLCEVRAIPTRLSKRAFDLISPVDIL
jgi:hypothetical protein